MNRRRLEVKILTAKGSSPEVVEIPLDSSSDSRLNLFVFRRPTTMDERSVEELVQISMKLSGQPGVALILEEEDKFEVYEVQIPTRYERTPII